MDFFNCHMLAHNWPSQITITLQLKLKKQLVNNYYVTIP